MKVQRRITWGCPSDWVENAKVAQVKVDQRHPGTNYIIPQGISCCLDAKKRKKLEPQGQARAWNKSGNSCSLVLTNTTDCGSDSESVRTDAHTRLRTSLQMSSSTHMQQQIRRKIMGSICDAIQACEYGKKKKKERRC